jgi:predicted Zn-dependent protease
MQQVSSRFNAWLRTMSGDYRGASEILRKAIGKGRSDPVLRYELINSSMMQDDIKAAREEIANFRRTAGDRPMLHVQEFTIALQTGEFMQAKEILDQISHVSGVDKKIVEDMRANYDFTMGRYADARRVFEMYAAKNRYDLYNRMNIVSVDICTGNVTMAEEEFNALQKEFPDAFPMRSLGASLMLRKGKYAEALAAAEIVLKSTPNSNGALSTKAMALIMLGRPSEALPIGKQIDSNIPKHPCGILVMARALQAMGKTREARALIPRIKALETHDRRGWPLFSSSALERELTEGK